MVLDCGSWKPQYEELLNFTDFAICSADFHPPGCASADDIFEYLKQKGVKYSAVSRGSESLLFQDEKGRGELPVKQVKVADTLGAGDFLHGAFCFWFLKEDYDFRHALQNAVVLAAFTCRFEGTRSWLKFAE